MSMIHFKPPLTDWDGLTLASLRYWPNDESKRLDLLRTCFPMLLDEKKRLFPEAYRCVEYWDQTNRVCEALGGWKAIAEAPPYSELKRTINAAFMPGLLVGVAFTLAHQIVRQGHSQDLVSLNKLAYLFEEYGEHLIRVPVSRATFMRAWMRYKPVAHLWAAHLAATGWWDKEGLSEPPPELSALANWSEQQTLTTLLYAQDFYQFGTTFKSYLGHEPLLNPDLTWRIDVEVEGEPFRLATMPEMYLKALGTYPKTRP